MKTRPLLPLLLVLLAWLPGIAQASVVSSFAVFLSGKTAFGEAQPQ